MRTLGLWVLYALLWTGCFDAKPFALDTSASVTIGPEGGAIVLDGARLDVPSGALAGPVEITITRIDASLTEFEPYSALYEFGPDGLQFLAPVAATFELERVGADAAVFWTEPGFTTFEMIGGTVAGSSIRADITHFSQGFAGNKNKQPCVDHDGDTYGRRCAAGDDCNDRDAAIHPGAVEVTNGIDDDCDGMIDGITTVPGAPTAVTATAGSSSATVSWTAPSSDGGSAITGYVVTSSPGGINSTTNGVTNVVVGGLINGTAYTFTVVATNMYGDSPASPLSNAVTPQPVIISGLTATANALGDVSIGWHAEIENDIDVYILQRRAPGELAFQDLVATNGLGPGTDPSIADVVHADGTYEYAVVASQQNGDRIPLGTVSVSVTIAPAAPEAPYVSLSQAGDRAATLYIGLPYHYGSTPITGFTITSSPGGITATTATTGYVVIDGLTNGTPYTLSVVATNMYGDGPPSSVSVTPQPVRAALLSFVAYGGRIDVTWTTTYDGGVATYRLDHRRVGDPVFEEVETVTASGVGNYRLLPYFYEVGSGQFEYRLRAVMNDGYETALGQSTLNVQNVPAPPTNLIAIPGNGQASLSWAPPPDTGGPAVTGYRVRLGGYTDVSPVLTDTSYVVTGLANGTTYRFAVIAINSVGESDLSNYVDVTPSP